MKAYTPLHCRSHYSLLHALSKPEKIASRTEEIEADACALTDYGTVSGSISFLSSMKKAKKKPILGCDLFVCKESSLIQDDSNVLLSNLPILAKNDAGWTQLIKLTSESNNPLRHYNHPRLSLDELAPFIDGNLISYSGHPNSDIANIILEGSGLHPNWRNRARYLAEWFRDTFGKDNFYLSVQRVDCVNSPMQHTLCECIREIAKLTGIPLIAIPDSHYATKSDAIDQRILLCSSVKKSLYECQNGAAKELGHFFNSSNFHIPTYGEMLEYGYTEEELDNTRVVADSISEYKNVLRSPILPSFSCPNGMADHEYLMQLCKEGLKARHLDVKSEYPPRLQQEMDIFTEAKISSYFLVVSDILDFCHKQGWLVGPGRGSAAGCLVSYATKITQIDPIVHDLWFERFYNAGRNTADRVSMPDIDIDVPIQHRETIIEYIKDKYGSDKVSQMLTYQTMKGRGALKAVNRAHGGVPNVLMNEMTENIPEESKISGELEEMKELRGESSILGWALENLPKKFSEWAVLNDDGTVSGPYAMQFEQAMRLEGTKVSQSRHPAGIVICPETLSNVCPMVIDTKTKKMIAGLEMNDLEAIGMLKLDILGIAFLDKMMGVQQILETGDILHHE